MTKLTHKEIEAYSQAYDQAIKLQLKYYNKYGKILPWNKAVQQIKKKLESDCK